MDYTPFVVVAAVLLAFVPPITGHGTFASWISRSLIFLVISCPCALVISIPMGFFAGIGNASSKGILVKGGNALEELSKIDAVAFDKTGTVTTGDFVVSKIVSEKYESVLAVLGAPVLTACERSGPCGPGRPQRDRKSVV